MFFFSNPDHFFSEGYPESWGFKRKMKSRDLWTLPLWSDPATDSYAELVINPMNKPEWAEKYDTLECVVYSPSVTNGGDDIDDLDVSVPMGKLYELIRRDIIYWVDDEGLAESAQQYEATKEYYRRKRA